ncbi:MAG TPA: glutathione S-transferase family protein [Myxococcota bacterium]|nr:glutathione S-transferase family protein [Myxococcota bacterium]
MKLYDFSFAPNPTKVRVYLAEKGIEVPKVSLNLVHGENRTPEMLARNPMGGLPFLELDDGTVITESLAIIEYFEELHPEPAMIGRDPLERALVRSLERMIETGVLNRAGRAFFNTSEVFRGRGQVPEAGAQALAELAGALEVVDREIGDRPFVAGERPTIADCTLLAALRHAERAGFAWPAGGFANLRRWWDDFEQRPSARA